MVNTVGNIADKILNIFNENASAVGAAYGGLGVWTKWHPDWGTPEGFMAMLQDIWRNVSNLNFWPILDVPMRAFTWPEFKDQSIAGLVTFALGKWFGDYIKLIPLIGKRINKDALVEFGETTLLLNMLNAWIVGAGSPHPTGGATAGNPVQAHTKQAEKTYLGGAY